MFLPIWALYWKIKWVISCQTGKNRNFTWLQQVEKRKGAPTGGVCAPMHLPICATSEELHPHKSAGAFSHKFTHTEEGKERIQLMCPRPSAKTATHVHLQPGWSIPPQNLQLLIAVWFLCRIWRKCMYNVPCSSTQRQTHTRRPQRPQITGLAKNPP